MRFPCKGSVCQQSKHSLLWLAYAWLRAIFISSFESLHEGCYSRCECQEGTSATCSRYPTLSSDKVPFVRKCVCWKLAVPSAWKKTLTLNIIEEVSVGTFVSVTCHLKYDTAITAGPWGLQCVGSAIWLPWSLRDSLPSDSDPEIINMALEAPAFCFSALVV